MKTDVNVVIHPRAGHLLSSRSVLRVLPLASSIIEHTGEHELSDEILLQVVISAATPWFSAVSVRSALSGVSVKYDERGFFGFSGLDLFRTSYFNEFYMTPEEDSLFRDLFEKIYIANKIGEISELTRNDAVFFEEDGSIILRIHGIFQRLYYANIDVSNIASGVEIGGEALWPFEEISTATLTSVREFRSRIDRFGNDWHVWRDWYDRRLRGGPIDFELERIYASMEPSWLAKGATAYNAELKRRLDALAERRGLEQPDESVPEVTTEALPEQVPQGARFDAQPAGPIRLADFAPPVDGLVDTPEQQEDWDDIRDKARAARALGPNRVPDALAEKLDRVLALDARIGAVRAQRLWSCFSSLRIALDAHEAGAAAESRTGEPDPRTLNGETAGALTDLVHTYNAFTLAQPKLLERDAARPGPQEAERLQEDAVPILPVLAAAAQDREITTAEAADALDTAREGLETPPESLPERQTVETAAATARNFVATLLGRAWRALCAEGGVAWKGVREGFYRAIGTTAYAAIPAAPFIAAHRDQLLAYVTTNFPGNTLLVKIIEAISRPFGV